MTWPEQIEAARQALPPGSPVDGLEVEILRRWWWDAAAPCSDRLAWPVGACGVATHVSPLDVLLARSGLDLHAVLAAVAIANAAAMAWAATVLGASGVAGTLAGVVALALSVAAASAGVGPGAASAWLWLLAFVVWYRARTGTSVLGLATAAGLTAVAGLGDPVWMGLAALTGMAFARSAGPRYLPALAVAVVLGHALAAWPGAGAVPVESAVVAGSLPPHWFLAPSGPVPLLLVALAGWQAWRGDAVDRALATLAGMAWVCSLGPRLVGPAGVGEGSHLPLAAWLELPGLAAFEAPWRFGLGAVGAALLLVARWSSGRRIAGAIAGGLLLGEAALRGPAWFPAPSAGGATVEASPPAWARALSELGDGAAAVLPLSPELRRFDHGLLWSSVHHHALLDAPRAWSPARRPAGWLEALSSDPFLGEWLRFERGRDEPGDPTRLNEFRHDPAALDALVARGLRWWVVVDAHHAAEIRGLGPASRALMTTLAGPASAAGEGWGIWDLAAVDAPPAVKAPPWRLPSTAGRAR